MPASTNSSANANAGANTADRNGIYRSPNANSFVDLTESGAFCSALPASASHKKELVQEIMQDAKPDRPRAPLSSLQEDMSSEDKSELQSLWQMNHDFNVSYFNNLANGIPVRLALAQNLGLDLSSLRALQSRAAKACASPDPNGATLANSYQNFAARLNAKNPRISDAQIDFYIKQATVALLEYHRMQVVFRTAAQRFTVLPPDNPERRTQAAGASEALIRLLVLRERFPFLQNAGLGPLAGASLVSFAQATIMEAYEPLQASDYYFGSKYVNRLMGYTAIARQSGGVDPEALIQHLQTYQKSAVSPVRIYKQVYTFILSGNKKVPESLRRLILDAVMFSVKQSLKSAQLKCEASPCSTFGLDPEMAARVVEAHPQAESLKPWLCDCHIGHQQTTVSNAWNLGLGLAGSAIGLACVLNPEISGLCAVAVASAVIDVGIGLSGIYDSVENRITVEGVSKARAGDAVQPIQEYDSQAESRADEFNYYANFVSAIMAFTYYKIIKHPNYHLAQIPYAILNDHNVQKATVVESLKGASSLPPPQLTQYNEKLLSTDPDEPLDP